MILSNFFDYDFNKEHNIKNPWLTEMKFYVIHFIRQQLDDWWHLHLWAYIYFIILINSYRNIIVVFFFSRRRNAPHTGIFLYLFHSYIISPYCIDYQRVSCIPFLFCTCFCFVYVFFFMFEWKSLNTSGCNR